MNIKQMSDRELYEYCRFVGAKARMWKRRFVALLPEVSRRGLHQKKGFATIVEFAAKVGGMGKKTVEAVFQVEKHICDKPFLQKALPEVGVDKVRVIATIATKENQKDLAEKVKTMSKPALELFARAMREESMKGSCQSPPGRRREQMSFSVDEEIAFKLRKFKQQLEKERKEAVEWNEVMKKLLEKSSERAAERRTTKPRAATRVSHRVSRYVPAKRKREIEHTYYGRCAFPSCNKPSEELHHPERFSIVRNHNNLKPLCKAHHELAHHRLIEHETESPTWWRIREESVSDKKVVAYRIRLL